MLILSGLVVVPALLVFKQPDLGTALTYIAVLVVGAFIAGLRWKYVAVIAVVTVVVLAVQLSVLEGLSEGAVSGFLDPDRDPQGTGYQLIQSKIAVGSGGDVR